MTVERKVVSHNGADYLQFNLLGKEVEGALTANNKRMVIKGKLSIENIINSHKYGRQIQIVVYTKEPLVEQARSTKSEWNRLEIYLSEENGKELFKTLTATYQE